MASVHGWGEARKGSSVLDRYPDLAFLGLHFLAFCMPNLVIQGWLGSAKILPLATVQVFNFTLLTCLVIGFLDRRPILWLMAILLLLSVVANDILLNYGSMPSVGIYYSILGSNRLEMIEYLEGKLPLVLVAVLALLVYLRLYRSLVGVAGKALGATGRKAVFATSLLLFVGIANWALVRQYAKPDQAATPDFHVQNSFPIGFLVTGSNAIQYLLAHRPDQSLKPVGAVRTGSVDQREIDVLVIGESASSNFWSMNGYPHPTNDRIRSYQDGGGLIYFPRTCAQANLTQFAVPMLVTEATPATLVPNRREKSLLTAFKETGFSTYWISNQEISMQFQDADFWTILNDYDRHGKLLKPHFDEEVVPCLERALASPARRLFVVLHLMGSHFQYSERVPPGFPTPDLPTDDWEASYARTLCYTDHVLGLILERLASVDGRCFMWYASDHGEILRRGEIGHGRTEPLFGEVQVPMFVWGNRAFWAASGPASQRLRQHQGEPVSQGATFPTFLGLAGIDYPGLDRTRDLSSPAYVAPANFPVFTPNGEVRTFKAGWQKP